MRYAILCAIIISIWQFAFCFCIKFLIYLIKAEKQAKNIMKSLGIMQSFDKKDEIVLQTEEIKRLLLELEQKNCNIKNQDKRSKNG